MFVASVIVFCCIPIWGTDAMAIGITLFLIAGIWHILADSQAAAKFRQPIEILPEWSSYSVDELRDAALDAVSSGDEWGHEIEAAFVKYAQALAASGLDREAIAKKLAKTGLTHSGAIDLCAEL